MNTYKTPEELMEEELMAEEAEKQKTLAAVSAATSAQENDLPAATMALRSPEATGTKNSLPVFDYESFAKTKPTYASDYADRIDSMLDELLNAKDFSYNAEADPLFQQYRAQYQREGQRSMEDTLASVASYAGGMNSYAVTAAQQASDYYNAQMMDKLPELAQLAYEMYLRDYELDVNKLGMLQQQEKDAYGRYQDELNEWYAELEAAYNRYRDDVADDKWQQQFDYGKEQDALAQQNWLEQMAYQKAQDELAQQNWQTQFDYNKAQDEIDNKYRQDVFDYERGYSGTPVSSGTVVIPSGGSSGSNYNNGSLNEDQIRELQNYYEVDADGKWGKESSAAAGGQSADQAWEEYTDMVYQPSSEPDEEDAPVSGKYTGTNYMQDAIDAAMRGDRETAEAALAARAEKMASPEYKGNGGGTSMAEAYAYIEELLDASGADEEDEPVRDTDGRTYDNGYLTRDQIAEMQNYYEVDADGMWGKASTAASGGQTAEEAWQEYSQLMGYNESDDDDPYNTKSVTNIDYDEETGEFIWANTVYDDFYSFQEAVENTDMTEEDAEELVRRLNAIGIGAEIQ